MLDGTIRIVVDAPSLRDAPTLSILEKLDRFAAFPVKVYVWQGPATWPAPPVSLMHSRGGWLVSAGFDLGEGGGPLLLSMEQADWDKITPHASSLAHEDACGLYALARRADEAGIWALVSQRKWLRNVAPGYVLDSRQFAALLAAYLHVDPRVDEGARYLWPSSDETAVLDFGGQRGYTRDVVDALIPSLRSLQYIGSSEYLEYRHTTPWDAEHEAQDALGRAGMAMVLRTRQATRAAELLAWTAFFERGSGRVDDLRLHLDSVLLNLSAVFDALAVWLHIGHQLPGNWRKADLGSSEWVELLAAHYPSLAETAARNGVGPLLQELRLVRNTIHSYTFGETIWTPEGQGAFALPPEAQRHMNFFRPESEWGITMYQDERVFRPWTLATIFVRKSTTAIENLTRTIVETACAASVEAASAVAKQKADQDRLVNRGEDFAAACRLMTGQSAPPVA